MSVITKYGTTFVVLINTLFGVSIIKHIYHEHYRVIELNIFVIIEKLNSLNTIAYEQLE